MQMKVETWNVNVPHENMISGELMGFISFQSG